MDNKLSFKTELTISNIFGCSQAACQAEGDFSASLRILRRKIYANTTNLIDFTNCNFTNCKHYVSFDKISFQGVGAEIPARGQL